VSRGPLRFKECDLRRAIRAAGKEGGGMTVDILPSGVIRLVPVSAGGLQNQGKDGEANPWDE
jgi:hypothetical protein